MSSFNKVILMGNITRDPQLKYLPSQTAVCEFGIAVNRKYKTASGEERDDVCFVDVSAFGKTGEVINQYLHKGDPIHIEGRLKFDSWEDKTSGGKRSKLSVIIDSFQFVGGKKSDGDDRQDEQPQRTTAQRTPSSIGQGVRDKIAAKPAPQQPFGDAAEFDPNDIPFAAPHTR